MRQGGGESADEASESADEASTRSRAVKRVPCRVRAAALVLFAQGAGAAAAWFLLPHGFGLGDPLAWANGPALAVLAGASLAGWLAPRRRRSGPLRGAAALWVGVWAGLALALPWVFPSTGPLALVPALGGLAGALLCWVLAGRAPGRVWLACLACGAALGWLQVHARRGADPGTRPANPAPPATLPRGSMGPVAGASVDGAGWVRLSLPHGARLELDPVLRFHSRSPDRAWTILAGRAYHRRVPFLLERVGRAPGVVQCAFGGPRPGVVELRAGGSLLVESRRTLPEPVYSHLNHAWAAGIRGPRGRWWVRFGEGERQEVLPHDYPVGRPARFAVLRRRGLLEVVEASSAEKGPFRTLAACEFEGPLTLEVGCEEGRVLRLSLLDWAEQASLQRSPTAGWGLPENAIEFWREESGAGIWISASYAATSVGRGWDSVGHAAGTYRNRIRIER